jgi:hypothetical protein
MVLRVALLDSQWGASFCLLKNISSSGVQIRLFAPLEAGSAIRLRVGDEDSVEGSVAWVLKDTAGITFKRGLAPGDLLRVRQKFAARRRRSSPRVEVGGQAIIATGGGTYAVELRDLSTSGAKVRTRLPIGPGRTAILSLPDLPRLKSYVRWSQHLDLGLVFETPIPVHILASWLEDRAGSQRGAPSEDG